MYQYQAQYQTYQLPYEGQLRSMSSMSTMNSETDSNTFQHSTSSAQTSTNSSPYNHKIHQQGGSHYQVPSTVHEETSPDLMNTEFYSSDNIDNKNHAQNFRQSMIYSDSLDSQHFQSIRDSIIFENTANSYDNSNTIQQEPTKLAMTNSPSFSALASILEKKSSTKYKPSSNLKVSTIREDEDFNEDHEQEIFYHPSRQHSSETLIVNNNHIIEESSPNLIQLDDTDNNIPRDVSFDSILPSPMDPNSIVAPQYYERVANNANDDIFKTPEVPQMASFNKEPSPAKKYQSMLEDLDEHENEDHIKTPIIKSTTIEDVTPKSTSTPISQTSKPLPKIRGNQGLASPQYKQRSSSLPVLTKKQSAEPKELKKKNKFISFFKSKRSVSSSQVEPAIVAKKESPILAPPPQIQPQLSISSSVSSPNLQQEQPFQPRTTKKSTSSTSLFEAFKRKNNKKQQPLTSKSFSDIPNITIEHNLDNNDDSVSVSTVESNEFNEDFNNLSTKEKRPTSQISSGGDMFPKSLNAEEIESIVSLERNRSIKSRHSTMSQRAISLSDAISLNAKEEGMYVTYDEKEPSIPDLSKSPSNSVLKKQGSINSLNRIYSDDYVEEDDASLGFGDFDSSLAFDHIADNYQAPSSHEVQIGDDEEEEEDVSNFMEFADFIDFGGDLNLNFDLENPSGSTQSSPRKTLRPSDDQPRLQPPLSTKPFNSPPSLSTASPLLDSPILQNQPFQKDEYSPALQPLPHFIQEQTSRPISMSFKGLRAPAFQNQRPTLTSSDSFLSEQSSKLSSVKVSNKKVGFSSKIVLYDAWNGDDYDRHPEIATCNQITPQLAQQIKEELNELKREMEIHEESRCFTHFY